MPNCPGLKKDRRIFSGLNKTTGMGACFSDRYNPLCLPGDTVFMGEAGRIDLPGADPDLRIDAIRTRGKGLISPIGVEIGINFCQHGAVQDDGPVDFPVVKVLFYIRDGDNGMDGDIQDLFHFL